MSALEPKEFDRAFRLHPREWRERNGAAAVGVLMDAAEASGRGRLPLSEKLSIHAHAASVWAERVLSRATRSLVASLALGTGIAVSLVYVVSFVLAPAAEDVYGGAIAAGFGSNVIAWIVAGTALATPWIIAGVLASTGHPRAARWAASSAFVVCIALAATHLLLPGLPLPSTRTLVFLGLWAALAALGEVRWSRVWPVSLLVGVLLTMHWLMLGLYGYPSDQRIWGDLSPWLFLILSGLFLCLLTAAACGYGSEALSGTIYTMPWAMVMIVGYARDGWSAAPVSLLFIAWLGASAAVVGIVWVHSLRRRRTTFIR
ncbi:hypothetical protein [Microbacterium halophytorum]|uniref:hypothetical protein n=1 Tax=Microbacterium halophytorum TaxID=2067568 RepID=UPI000CFB32E6|nr:hypothetical protein [Microbacterium halophytorum]